MLFITTCTARRRPLLATFGAQQIIETIWRKSESIDGWFVGRYVLMPDHIHFFAKPGIEAKPLSDWMKTWKSISSRRLAGETGVIAPIWQPDYFDHFVRSAEAYEEKWEYVCQNPVRQGLCKQADDWPYRAILNDLRFR